MEASRAASGPVPGGDAPPARVEFRTAGVGAGLDDRFRTVGFDDVVDDVRVVGGVEDAVRSAGRMCSKRWDADRTSATRRGVRRQR